MNSARTDILTKLKTAQTKLVLSRPELPALKELALNEDELVTRFTQEVTAQTGGLHRVKDSHSALTRLTTIFQKEKIKTVMMSNDDVVTTLDVPAWGRQNKITVLESRNFRDRTRFINAVFNEAEAGITGVDVAVAESGTIGFISDKDHARLISLAPIHHVAIVPIANLVAVYEDVTKILYGKWENAPSHFTFITGPSMTADIQATMFKGMHGPAKLDVVLIG
jgi:L-lactate dehydrogenase complex protein LldG